MSGAVVSVEPAVVPMFGCCAALVKLIVSAAALSAAEIVD